MNQQLSEGNEPTQELQSFQEQLIASKLREAEANLAIKELQHSILELEKRWNAHLQRHGMLIPENNAFGIYVMSL